MVASLTALAVIGTVVAQEMWSDAEATGMWVVLGLVVGTGMLLAYVAWSVTADMMANERAREELALSEARVTGLVSIAADAIITIDATHRITLFNQGAEQIFGWRADEMIGQGLERLLPARFHAGHHRMIDGFNAGAESARRMGDRREISGVRKSGEEFPAEASILKQTLDGATTFTVVLRDITERKHVEDSQRFLADAGSVLTRTLEFDETLAAVAQLPVPRLADACIVDVIGDGGAGDGRGDFRLRRTTSVSEDPRVNMALAALAADAPGPDSASATVDVFRTGKPLLLTEIDDDFMEAHSETPEALARARALAARSAMLVPLQAREKVFGVMSFVSVGARRYGPADLDLAKQLASRAAFAIDNARLFGLANAATRARDDMLGVVSHDLRNPVNAIGMVARVLRESPPEDPAARADLVNAISDAAEWMDRLIRDLLDSGAIEAGRLSLERHREDVRPIVDSAVAMFEHLAEERGVILAVQCPEDLPPVDGDSARLVQVLCNLVSNAITHTERNGVVSVVASVQGSDLQFVVRDTGVGISREHLPHVFERHWRVPATKKKGGLGLGLAIAHGIVVAHGGRIWVESEPGQGTAFFVSLPLETPAA
ncbi:MAG: PAS domain S-box protein [Gemmatimonadetes bacterium]|nr:PAS domain S-box protein [Gemmatimonadota bacterium]